MKSVINILAVFFMLVLSVPHALADKATFAGGCFWCMEQAFQDLEGVTDVISGFTGGTLENPTYNGNHEGHYEAIEVTFDPNVISYGKLLETYWRNIDPFDSRGQFCDKGSSYLSAIFVAGEAQRALAERSKNRVEMQFPDQRVVTPVLKASKFYPVEEYHQDYYKKNPIRYRFYKTTCGRASRLKEIWGS